jgi:hypothetical protein
MSKTNEELVREFLEKGGKIEVLPPADNNQVNPISSITSQPVKLLSLEEAESLYGEKTERKSKAKKPDLKNINMNLIPDHLKKYILSKFDNDITKENE